MILTLTLPLNHGLQVGLIKWTERPSTWIKRPTCSTYRILLGRNTTMDFIHMWIMMSVKREAEMCQTQASRPRRGRPASNCQHSGNATTTNFRKQSQTSVQRRWPGGQNPRPARPRGGQPAPLCSVSCSSSRGSYVNRPSCLQLTPRPNTNL